MWVALYRESMLAVRVSLLATIHELESGFVRTDVGEATVMWAISGLSEHSGLNVMISQCSCLKSSHQS